MGQERIIPIKVLSRERSDEISRNIDPNFLDEERVKMGTEVGKTLKTNALVKDFRDLLDDSVDSNGERISKSEKIKVFESKLNEEEADPLLRIRLAELATDLFLTKGIEENRELIEVFADFISHEKYSILERNFLSGILYYYSDSSRLMQQVYSGDNLNIPKEEHPDIGDYDQISENQKEYLKRLNCLEALSSIIADINSNNYNYKDAKISKLLKNIIYTRSSSSKEEKDLIDKACYYAYLFEDKNKDYILLRNKTRKIEFVKREVSPTRMLLKSSIELPHPNKWLEAIESGEGQLVCYIGLEKTNNGVKTFLPYEHALSPELSMDIYNDIRAEEDAPSSIEGLSTRKRAVAQLWIDLIYDEASVEIKRDVQYNKGSFSIRFETLKVGYEINQKKEINE